MPRRCIERRLMRMGRARRLAFVLVEFLKPFRRAHGQNRA
jgi:hypothetical protein